MPQASLLRVERDADCSGASDEVRRRAAVRVTWPGDRRIGSRGVSWCRESVERREPARHAVPQALFALCSSFGLE